MANSTRFGDDVSFLRAHHGDLIVLSRGDARVAVAPRYQGRVMTSTAAGERGMSFGWINRGLIASGELTPHMNAFGGEDRFWLGPEGGQYALYFPPGAAYDFEHWQVPAVIDTEAWAVATQSETEVTFRHDTQLTNHMGTALSMRIERTIRVLDPAATTPALTLPASVQAVAYESVNAIENTGGAAWTTETGLVSIWILSMYTPSDRTTVVIPFVPGSEEARGRIVNDAYFGQVPEDRLVIDEENGILFFRADGRHRSKIGVSHARAFPVAGSWDADHGALTLVYYTLPDSPTNGYVNSMWEHQRQPYAGDVVNSYNDGPPAPGAAPLGPFYEIESSSPAAALRTGERIEHIHRTFHLTGDRAALNAIAEAHLGVGLDRIEAAFADR